MGILWIVLVGFVAGIVARLLAPGPNKPAGFLLTTALGIAGAFVATFIGQAVGWYRADRARASSPPPWARSSCCSSGTASRRRARPRRVGKNREKRHGVPSQRVGPRQGHGDRLHR
ncbi:MAG: hypothetical protein QOJ15_447 [Bradyrhizobium sp.]|nr:hypothetical protein [Bradyrhizobium sp.]